MSNEEIEQQRINEKFYEIIKDDVRFVTIEKKLEEIKDDPDIDMLRRLYCDELVYEISEGYMRYERHDLFEKNELINMYIRMASKLSKDRYFYWMIEIFGQLLS